MTMIVDAAHVFVQRVIRYVFDIVKLHSKNLQTLTKRDGDPIRLRGRPLQLVNFRAGFVRQDGI